jgi:hypothetical protein
MYSRSYLHETDDSILLKRERNTMEGIPEEPFSVAQIPSLYHIHCKYNGDIIERILM